MRKRMFGRIEDLLSSTNITFLKDSIVTLPNGVQIVGRDDRFNKSRSSLQELMNRVNLNGPVIVLDHQPNEVELVEQFGIDLQFSGHTHRGQVWPISWITDLLFPQSYGYRKWGESHVYVSSGLSLWGPPFRIGTDSEMVGSKIYQRAIPDRNLPHASALSALLFLGVLVPPFIAWCFIRRRNMNITETEAVEAAITEDNKRSKGKGGMRK